MMFASEEFHVTLANGRQPNRPWRITSPFLKLALKYGVIGPWRSPNWSIAFDAYALRRGPQQGLPTRADFTVTLLMNSRADSRDLNPLTAWMRDSTSVRELSSIRNGLMRTAGLHERSHPDIEHLGGLVNRMITANPSEHDQASCRSRAAPAPSRVARPARQGDLRSRSRPSQARRQPKQQLRRSLVDGGGISHNLHTTRSGNLASRGSQFPRPAYNRSRRGSPWQQWFLARCRLLPRYTSHSAGPSWGSWSICPAPDLLNPLARRTEAT